MALTQSEDTDLEILQYLDDKNLGNVFLVSRDLHRYYQNPDLWRYKIAREYSPAYIAEKLPEEHFRQQYINIKKIKTPVVAARKGCLYVLRRLEDHKRFNRAEVANKAAGNCHLHILNWLETKGFLPDKNGANTACERGHLPVLIWLESRKIFPTHDGVRKACQNGQLEILKWLEKFCIHPAYSDTHLATPHLEVLEWFHSKGIPLSPKCSNRAFRLDDFKISEWLWEQGCVPDQTSILWACASGRLDKLEWLEQKEAMPWHSKMNRINEIALCSACANVAVLNKQLKVMDWLAQRKILPDQKTANLIIDKNQLSTADWLAEKGILPDRPSLLKALLEDRFEAANWLVQRGITLDPELSLWILIKGSLQVSRWLLKNGFQFDEKTADQLVRTRDEKKLKLLLLKGIRPTSEAVDRALVNKDFSILDLLAEKKILPKKVEKIDLTILKWLDSWDVPITQSYVDRAAGEGQVETLNWLAQKKKLAPSEKGIDTALENQRLEVLNWFKQRGVKFKIGAANEALLRKNYQTLDWLYWNGISPAPEVIREVIIAGDTFIIKWLLERKSRSSFWF